MLVKEEKITQFKGLKDDLTFKKVFSNKLIMQDLVNSFLQAINYDAHYVSSNVELQSIILPDNKFHKVYYGDIVATLSDGSIIDIEMFKNNFDDGNYKKSLCYMCRLYASQLKYGNKDYKRINKVISLNLMSGNFKRPNMLVT